MERGVMFFLIVLVLSGSVSAIFSIGNPNYSVEDNYAPEGYLSGWINISLSSEESSSVFEDSLGNSVTLIDLIKSNKNFKYNCSTATCDSDYSAFNASAEKTFNLDLKKSKIVGIKFTGEITSINSVDFVIESDAQTSCYNQLKIDFLNDGTIDFGNNKASVADCSFLRNYGCFNNSQTAYEVIISPVPFCQRIRISESPGFRLGAWVKEEVSGDKKLKMSIYSINGDLKASCELPKTGISQGAEIYCEVDYLTIKPEEHYVCIYSDENSGTYKVKGYSGAVNCGFNGFPVVGETNSYKIFAEGKSFESVGTLNISNSFSNEISLGSMVSDYILRRYGSFECTNGCIVPITILSEKNQRITLKNLKVNYNKLGLPGITENNFYDLKEIPAKIDADFQKLYLDGKFLMPSQYKTLDYKLNFKSQEILSETLIVGKVPQIKSLTPVMTFSAFPTTFEAGVEMAQNISEYEWNFGDGTAEISSTNKITHTYDLIGNYEIEVTITDNYGNRFSKSFNISVGSPKEVINTTINEKKENLENVESQLDELEHFYKESLDSVLKISEIYKKLELIQKEYRLASSDEEYNKIMSDLVNLDVPVSLTTTKITDSFLFYPKRENIDIYALSMITGEEYEFADEDNYKDAVYSWNQQNMDTRMTFKEILVRYESSEAVFLKGFEIELQEKQTLDSNPYLILKELENLKFAEGYLEEEESGYFYIELEEPQTIQFSTTEDIEFADLPLFVSPSISKLIVKKTSYEEEKKFSNTIIMILILVLLTVSGFIAYIVLQIWYKNKYERYLFQNRNDLYNLVTYIENAKKRGYSEGDIFKKLRDTGWKSEQISYALKKHAGKRTGMIEIPLLWKIIHKLRNKEIKPLPRGSSRFMQEFMARRDSGHNKFK